MFDFLKPILSRAERERVSAAVAAAEAGTSGEIHVHLAKTEPGVDLLETAKRKFTELGLDRTKRRNGVIILVAIHDRKAAIWGDEGIDRKAGRTLWDKALAAMIAEFSRERYAEGIEAGVREAGRALAEHFPPEGGDVNELPDEVS